MFAHGRADLGDERGDLADAVDDFRHRVSSGLNPLTPGLYADLGGFDQDLDFLGRSGTSMGKVAHLAGYHCEALSILPCTCGLDCCIQRKDIGLIGDTVDDADDLPDP